MKIKNILAAFIIVFFGCVLLVDCAHKKQDTETEAGQGAPETPVKQTDPNSLSDQEKEDGWQLLFDGTSFSGWRSFKEETVNNGWIVEDGTMMALGKGGDLGGDVVTEKMYRDFELRLEWKISPGGNSGIFFRVLEEDHPTVYATGPEYQIVDDLGFPEPLENWQTTGANYGLHPPENPKIKPAGEWNTSRIVVQGAKISHYLNGSLVVAYELWTEEWNKKVQESKWADYPEYGRAKSGFIGLQDHGNKVWFRNIRIKEL